MIIAIIGAGASGMAAALAASENRDDKIILVEKQPRVGKKLQATGNGRCNLSNIHASIENYHGTSPDFCRDALQKYSVEDTLNWFRSLGLITIAEPSGKVYPYSDQANSVLDILRFALDRPNIELKCNCEISRVRRNSNGFILESNLGQISCDRLIVACGGLAGTKLGGSLSGYKLLQSLGHTATKLRPSLVQIKTNWKGNAGLKGVRANCKVTITCDNRAMISSEGEIQFTDYGLSGPVIFEISRDVCSTKGKWEAKLDFLPQMSQEDLQKELIRRKSSSLTTDDLLTGILHNRLGRVLTKEAGLPFSTPISQIDDSVLKRLCKLTKDFSISLTEPMGMDQAQVTAGGIKTDEFDASSMESKIIPGLFACGEVLDIDGDCGGYNLQWAWSSGRLAGENAIK